MNENIIEDIEIFIKNHLLLKKIPKFKNWYDKEIFWQNVEEDLLKELSVFLQKKYSEFYTLDNLQYISKLFLLYPNGLPKKLNELNWDITKIILSIFSEQKRTFYINLCYEKKFDISTLKKYLNEEIYEKYCYCLSKYYKNKNLSKKEYYDLIDKVFSISKRII